MTSASTQGGHLHILGICGTLMGSIALLARERGFEVTGSDRQVYPPMSDQLRDAGIEVREGYKAEHLTPRPDLVMIGNAGLPRGNEAVEAVLDARIPYTSGAEWLARYVLNGRQVLAVSGTHGKTTTTAMLAFILHEAGLDPGFLIGGVPADFDGSAHLGSSDLFVIEADEYDTSYFDRRSKFLHYLPTTLILGNIEFDHADIFPNLEAIKNSFHHLLRTVPGNGLIIAPGDDDNVTDVLGRGCWTPVESFGVGTRDTTWTVGADRSLSLLGKHQGTLQLALPGVHNLGNAAAAVAAAHHVGVSPRDAIASLARFRGVKRRMEIIHTGPGITVYDDFAHHPTAIEKTLSGLRERVGGARIVAVIEPASHTMRGGTHKPEVLRRATSTADATLWYQPPGAGWDMQGLTGATVSVTPHIDHLLDAILREAAGPEAVHVLIMSNGAFGGLHQRVRDALAA